MKSVVQRVLGEFIDAGRLGKTELDEAAQGVLEKMEAKVCRVSCAVCRAWVCSGGRGGFAEYLGGENGHFAGLAVRHAGVVSATSFLPRSFLTFFNISRSVKPPKGRASVLGCRRGED